MIRQILLVAIWVSFPFASAAADDPRMWQTGGVTMGTTYSVKVFDPPDFDDDIRLTIDAELRQVNDQMSTYLKSSEISRFNASESTDWFAVSDDTAMVVAFAQQVAEKTGGAFDVTVGPLVNAWNFGPDSADAQGKGPQPKLPDEAQIKKLLDSIGYQKLEARTEPPALRKSVPGLQVDLSALAKGHGVDRVVELLAELGAENVFVEIGGEVRTSGSKDGVDWRVGIQLPDTVRNSVMIAHPMSVVDGRDESMATSGDYRNFFVVDGTRYSHTLDPRTGRPVEHSLASVSVIASTCMAADAWATAINVLGQAEGVRLAEQEKLDTLLVSRDDDRLTLFGTGVLAKHATGSDGASSDRDESSGPPLAANDQGGGNRALAVVLLTTTAFGVVLTAMAVGVIFGRRAISGSCGGLSSPTGADGSVSCSLCSNPANACKELRERMQKEAGAAS